LFREEVYQDVKQKNPDAKVAELTKIIGEMWSKIDPAHKARLEASYRANKEKAD
jgi:sRNA-binding carbon storage regulator CsrA